jgi:hypothetical protein
MKHLLEILIFPTNRTMQWVQQAPTEFSHSNKTAEHGQCSLHHLFKEVEGIEDDGVTSL